MEKIRKQFLKEFFAQNRILFLITFITMVLLGTMNLVISYLLQQLTDIAMGRDIKPLITLLWYTVFSILAFLIISMIKRYTYSKFLAKAMLQYKNFAFREITRKSIHSFQGENTSKYISALTNDATSIEQNYMRSVFSLVVKMVSFLGAFAMMIWYSPILTLVAVLLTFIPVIASLICGNRLVIAEKEVSDQNERFVGTVKDILSGFSVIKSFKAEDEIYKLYKLDNQDLEYKKYGRMLTQELVEMIGGTASIIAQMGVFIVGAYLAIEGKGVTPGIVIVFVQLMNFVVEPISTVPSIISNRKASKVLMNKLAIALCDNIREEGKQVANKLDDCIKFQSVTFGYDNSKTVLKEFSYQFDVGKSYAIVGGSGSGKSTLLNLLMGSFSDYNGQILFDEQELREIHSTSLYDIVSIVQQNVFVFNSSIRDNITMFKEFEKDKIEHAIEMSGLSLLLKQKGEDCLCGENGCNLSGGERQRISIARCLLQETPVLLVDEATAALDAKTAFEVTNSILRIAGLTRIIVTHALEENLLRQYDQILVLRNGLLCESGNFEELMGRREYFYSLYNVAK